MKNRLNQAIAVKRCLGGVWIAAGLLAMSSCRVAAPREAMLTEVHATAIIDSVTATLEQFRTAFSASDIDAVMRFYADDPRFRWVEGGELRYTSKGALATAFRALRPLLRSIELSYFDPVVTPLAPGVAAVATRFVQKVTDTAGVTRGFAGAMSMTLIHADSGWRFLLGHTSAVVARSGGATK